MQTLPILSSQVNIAVCLGAIGKFGNRVCAETALLAFGTELVHPMCCSFRPSSRDISEAPKACGNEKNGSGLLPAPISVRIGITPLRLRAFREGGLHARARRLRRWQAPKRWQGQARDGCWPNLRFAQAANRFRRCRQRFPGRLQACQAPARRACQARGWACPAQAQV